MHRKTLRILQAAQKAKIKKFIFKSFNLFKIANKKEAKTTYIFSANSMLLDD